MALSVAAECEWTGYLNDAFDFANFETGSRVLDVGCGPGRQLARLRARGCRAVGLDPDPASLADGRFAGLHVCRAVAEALPFQATVFDGLVCKVVVPYTDEARAIREIARVLRPGGIARVSYHGLGYFLRYLLDDPNWKRKCYGARTLGNTWWYARTGKRFPGFLGDTLYQSERRLRGYYESVGLELVQSAPSARYLGAPVFIYHVLRRQRGCP